MEKYFVGRQPICKDTNEVFGYELLCRNSELDQPSFKEGDAAASELLVNSFIDIGLDKVIGRNLALVNVSRDFLLSEFSLSLPPDRVVLTIPEDTMVDPPLLEALSRISGAGYPIALSGFTERERVAPLAEFADFGRLDIQAVNREAVVRQAEMLRQFGLKVMADKVETLEDYEFCKKTGFDYYQGFYFCKPHVATHRKIPFNRLSTLHLLAKLQDPNITPQELEHAVGQNMAIAYRVLRYLNSPMHAFPRKIESIRHAVMLVGTRLLSNWASLALLETIENKPRELMVTAMVRAHMCQQLGVALYQRNMDQFFTVGLLSVIDALLDRPLREALLVMPLADSIKDALLNHKGLMGTALNCVKSYERGDWANTRCGNLDEKTIREAYLSGVVWTRNIVNEFAA